ncbi:MAG: hypothetical protein MUF24_05405 [Chitinophagaceae bacterium]|nr:hypothetical protein [Chitinophagaceae bacterium]
MSTYSFAQNIGIGTATPLERLDVGGNIRTSGLRIPGAGSINLGVDVQNKEQNAGRIGYALFTPNTLDIIGAGSGTDNRRIRLWAEDVTEFTGKGHFFSTVGIGTVPVAGLSLAVAGGNAMQLSLRNTNAMGNDVRSGLAFGGNNYTTGIIQTIGSANNIARMAFFTGYSFEGGISNLAERLTILNDGKVGIGRTVPSAQLEVGASNTGDWFRILANNDEVFKVNNTGILFTPTKSTYHGAALVNSNAGGLARWAFTTLGTEMVMGGTLQTIPHGIATKINFGNIVWEQNNIIPFDNNNEALSDVINDWVTAPKDGIAMIDYQLDWFRGASFNPNEVRNGALIIKLNGTLVRRINSNAHNQQGMIFTKVQKGQRLTFEVYHEHCLDPPGLCITTINQSLAAARVSVIIL